MQLARNDNVHLQGDFGGDGGRQQTGIDEPPGGRGNVAERTPHANSV